MSPKGHTSRISTSDRLAAAGLHPEPHENGRLINIFVAGTNEALETSYYPSIREGSGRDPEIRMGRGLVNWLREGDSLLLATDGHRVFALKNPGFTAVPETPEQVEQNKTRISHTLSNQRLRELAQASIGPPARRVTESAVFERNPYVREYARRRSGGRCEMPGCGYVGFIKTDGTLYIEVHHVQFMGAEGHDVIGNVAAICPTCHAKAHYARDRDEMQRILLEAVAAANIAFSARR